MLVAAYLVLFVAVLLFAWSIEAHYGQREPHIGGAQDEHARLALLYAARAHAYMAHQQVTGELRVAQAVNSSNPVARSVANSEYFGNSYLQPGARMESPGRRHHRMSLVAGAANSSKPAQKPPFSAKSNPAKLALVPRRPSPDDSAGRS